MSPKSNSYGRSSQEKAREMLDKRKRMQTQFWLPKIGSNHIRIMPPWKEDFDEFWKECYIHWRVGPEEKMFYCPREMNGQLCAICDYVDELADSEEESDRVIVSDTRAKASFLYNIVDLDERERGVQVFRSGIKIFEQLLNFMSDDEWGDFTDPDDGYDVIINKSGEGRNTDYDVRLRRNPTPIQNEEWLDSLIDLDTMVPLATNEDMEAALTGIVKVPSDTEEVDDDFGEPLAKPPSKPSPSPVRKTKRSSMPEPTVRSRTPVAEVEVEEDVSDAEDTPECFGKEYYQIVTCEDCGVQDDCLIEQRKATQSSKRPKKRS